jgi:hypothetical protein
LHASAALRKPGAGEHKFAAEQLYVGCSELDRRMSREAS